MLSLSTCFFAFIFVILFSSVPFFFIFLSRLLSLLFLFFFVCSFFLLFLFLCTFFILFSFYGHGIDEIPRRNCRSSHIHTCSTCRRTYDGTCKRVKNMLCVCVCVCLSLSLSLSLSIYIYIYIYNYTCLPLLLETKVIINSPFVTHKISSYDAIPIRLCAGLMLRENWHTTRKSYTPPRSATLDHLTCTHGVSLSVS